MNTELRDIKPLLEIPDHSYVVFLGLALFMGIVILSLFFILFRKFWLKRKVNMKKVYFERLKNIDWKYSKQAAYEATVFGRYLADEPRTEEIYKQLVVMLEPYKYRQIVPSVDEETLKQYNLLVHVIDESL